MVQEQAVNPGWRTSSYSANGGGNCVEAGYVPGLILVRDTEDGGTGPVLRVRAQAWRVFTASLRAS